MSDSLKDAAGHNVTYVLGTDGNVWENWLTSSNGWSGWELNIGTPAVKFTAL